MAPASVFDQILDYTNRANPYPLYAELRRTPVSRADDGSYPSRPRRGQRG